MTTHEESCSAVIDLLRVLQKQSIASIKSLNWNAEAYAAIANHMTVVSLTLDHVIDKIEDLRRGK